MCLILNIPFNFDWISFLYEVFWSGGRRCMSRNYNELKKDPFIFLGPYIPRSIFFYLSFFPWHSWGVLFLYGSKSECLQGRNRASLMRMWIMRDYNWNLEQSGVRLSDSFLIYGFLGSSLSSRRLHIHFSHKLWSWSLRICFIFFLSTVLCRFLHSYFLKSPGTWLGC